MAKTKSKSTRITPESVEKVNTKATEKNVAKVHAEAINAPVEQADYPKIDFISDGTGEGVRLIKELNAKPKTLYFIALQAGEKKGDYFEYAINGCKCYIPRGEMVYIPVRVAEEIERARLVTSQAGDDLKTTDDKPKGKYLGVFKKLN